VLVSIIHQTTSPKPISSDATCWVIWGGKTRKTSQEWEPSQPT